MFHIIRTKYAPLNIRVLKALKQEYAKNVNLCFFWRNWGLKCCLFTLYRQINSVLMNFLNF